MRLKDVAVVRPRILFVGINPSLRSGEVGHHFASPGNPFWRLLHAAGLTPVQLAPEEDVRLAEYGLALTNLCPRATRTASELRPDELAQGGRALRRKVKAWKPELVALVGLTLYPKIVGKPLSGGPGLKAETMHGARLFVLPNPSGLNASFPGFASKLVWFERLRAAVEEQERAAGGGVGPTA